MDQLELECDSRDALDKKVSELLTSFLSRSSSVKRALEEIDKQDNNEHVDLEKLEIKDDKKQNPAQPTDEDKWETVYFINLSLPSTFSSNGRRMKLEVQIFEYVD